MIFDDPNIAWHILSILMDARTPRCSRLTSNNILTLHGPDWPKGNLADPMQRWKIKMDDWDEEHPLRRRILVLQLVNRNFRNMLREKSTVPLLLTCLHLLRTDPTRDKYILYDVRDVVSTMGYLRAQTVEIGSVGNGFDASGMPIGIPPAEFLSKTHTLRIRRLSGLLSLGNRPGESSIEPLLRSQKPPLLPPLFPPLFPPLLPPLLPCNIRNVVISEVGHSGLLNLCLLRRLFHNCSTCVFPNRTFKLTSEAYDMRCNVGDGVRDLTICAPMPVRMEKREFSGVMEFYMDPVETSKSANEDAQNMSMAKMLLAFCPDAKLKAAQAPKGGVPVDMICNGSRLIDSYRMNRDLGWMYMSMLDFRNVEKLTIRAYECYGAPVRYEVDTQNVVPIMHSTREIHLLLEDDYKLLGTGRYHDMITGEYFPGYMAVVDMVRRSTKLREIVYTGVMAELLNDAGVRSSLVDPWKKMVESRGLGDSPGDSPGDSSYPTLRVYVLPLDYDRPAPGVPGPILVDRRWIKWRSSQLLWSSA